MKGEMIKRLFILILLASSANVMAQNKIIDFINKLQIPEGQARVRIKMDTKSRTAIQAFKTEEEHSRFRIRIFFDSGQDARNRGSHVKAQFGKLYPTIPVYFSYKNPHYLVDVGNYITKAEANKTLGIISASYPHAFITEVHIPISLLIEPKPKAPEESELVESENETTKVASGAN